MSAGGKSADTRYDPDFLTGQMIDASNRLNEHGGAAGLGQALVMIAASGFSIAAAIRDLASAARERRQDL